MKWIVFLILFPMLSCSRLYLKSSNKIFITPQEFHYNYNSLLIPIKDGVNLPAWHISQKSNKKLIIQFHGNSENRSSHFYQLTWMLDQGYDLLTFDYRGFGELTSYVENLKEDTLGTLKYIYDHYNSKYDQIVFIGQSMGGYLLYEFFNESSIHFKNASIVFDSTFASYMNLFSSRILNLTFTPLKPKMFNQIKKIVIFHGLKDQVVPSSMGRFLYKTITNSNAKLFIIENAKHLETFLIDKRFYRQVLINELEGVYVETTNPIENCNLNCSCDLQAKKYQQLGSRKLSQNFYRAKDPIDVTINTCTN